MESTKLYDTLKENNLEALTAAVGSAEEDISARDENGQSYLHHAIKLNASEDILKVLASKIDITIQDADTNTALDLAVQNGDAAKVKVFQDYVKQLSTDGEQDVCKEKIEELVLKGWPLLPEIEGMSEDMIKFLKRLPVFQEKLQSLSDFIEKGDLRGAKQMMDRKKLGVARDGTGMSILHKTVLFEQSEILTNLTQNFGNALNIQDNMGRTAAHYAAAIQDEGALYKILTDAGADETIKDVKGNTPPHYKENHQQLGLADMKTKMAEIVTRKQELVKKLVEITGQKPLSRPTSSQSRPASASKSRPTSAQKSRPTSAQKSRPASGQKSKPSSAKKESEEPKPESAKKESEEAKPESAKKEEAPKPATPKKTYVDVHIQKKAEPPNGPDAKYVAEVLGDCLAMALSEVCEKRPWDPIEYLAHWLYKHKDNLNREEKKKDLVRQLEREKIRHAEELETAEKLKLEVQQMKDEEIRKKIEKEEEERKQREREALQKKAKEQLSLSQPPELPTVTEAPQEETDESAKPAGEGEAEQGEDAEKTEAAEGETKEQPEGDAAPAEPTSEETPAEPTAENTEQAAAESAELAAEPSTEAVAEPTSEPAAEPEA